MKVTKSSIHRITVDMTGCGCFAMQEFEDADFKKPIGKATFTACKKHIKQPGVDIIEMLLTELLEKEALDHKVTPVAPVNPTRPNASAVVNAEGQLEMRVPINRPPTVGKVKVQASGSHAAPGSGRVSAAQAARTGPAKAFIRPTASTPRVPQPPAGGLATALAQDDEVEDDLLAQNDPERAY
jgi:hypothetical protein